jgi:lipopolysaccharide/colanic/teichoic acid biosynthesis glycosyltransferase
MWKLRSMYVDADVRRRALAERDDGNGVLFKVREDPRVTPVGRVLRRYSLDELPQLFNVVRGDMSLVGPRPPLGEEVARYEDAAHRRLRVRPGLTGLWQVSGRSDLSWEESVRLDLRYVDNWSVAMDLMILWKTARAVVGGSGAY